MENLELEARIRAQPETEAYQVYGDWLADRGDARGELVAIQTKLVAKPMSRELRSREQSLLAKHRNLWLGELALLSRDELELTWSNGFIDWVKLAAKPSHLAALARIPCVGLVRHLVLGRSEEPTYDACFDVLAAEADRICGLAKLSIAERAPFLSHVTTTGLGDLARGGRAVAGLVTLTMRLGAPNVRSIDLPSLRTLSITATHWSGPDFTAFGEPRWPNLERLALQLGEDGSGARGFAVDLLDELLGGGGMPNLTHLALTEVSDIDLLLESLARSPLLARLETLDLTGGHLRTAGVDTLLEHRAAFAQLELLDLSESLTEGAADDRARLGALPNVECDGVREPFEGDDDYVDEDYYDDVDE